MKHATLMGVLDTLGDLSKGFKAPKSARDKRKGVLVKKGFKQAMDPKPDDPTDIMHGSHFVLIDRRGVVRGYYRTQAEGLSDLVRDARRLAAE